MKKLILTISALGMFSFASAQYKSGGGGAGDKWYFGGGLGLSLGTDVTTIGASPLVGYKITDRFSTGMRITYQYVNNKVFDISFSNYGGGPFTRFQFTDKYFSHIEYEYLNFEFTRGVRDSNGDFVTDRDSYNALWMGAGYSEQLGRNGGVFLLALYNVLYDDTDQFQPYASPFSVRVGFSVGF